MTRMTQLTTNPTAAAIGLAIGGLMWGLYWVPLRYLAGLGMGGAWPGALIFLGAGAALTPFIWSKRAEIRANWWALLSCGMLTGAAFSLFSTAIMLTDVIRAILLFYMTPVWSTGLGLLFLGERLTPSRLGALILGLAGLMVVLGLGAGWPVPRSAGDLMALASGVVWAVGSLRLYRFSDISVSEQVFAFIWGGFVIAGLTILLGGAALSPLSGAAAFGSGLLAATLIAVIVLPVLFLTVWPATLLSPGRVGLILMTEVVAGVLSAALFAGEVFGWREALGSVMIIGAGLIEVLGPRVFPGAAQPGRG